MNTVGRTRFLTTALQMPLNGRLVSSVELPFRIGKSLAWAYKSEAKGEFPKRMRTGQRSVAWRGDEIQAWIDSRAEA